MIAGFVDTNILIEVYRGNQAAKSWFESTPDLALSSIAWLELIEGASGKAGQRRCLEVIGPLDLVFVTEQDQRWAMSQVIQHRLSRGLTFKDCLIASVCYRLQLPLYTKNVKDFIPTLGASLVIRPY